MDRLLLLESSITRLERRAERLQQVSNKYWTARRAIFISGLLLASLSCGYSGSVAGWVVGGLFVVVFCVIAIYHGRVLDGITTNSVMLNIKLIQVARIRLDWDQMPRPEQTVDESNAGTSHPFEADLDITGGRSLHRLLDSAVTREGSDRLKSWLLNGAPDPQLIAKRQSLVHELKGRALFRDKLQLYSALTGRDSKVQWNSSVVVTWFAQHVNKDSLLPTVTLLGILAALNIALVVLAVVELIPHVWPVVFLIYLGVMIARQSRIATSWGELQDLEEALSRFKAVFEYLESRTYQNCPGLAELCRPFLDKEKRPSRELKRLARLASALGLRTNALLWLAVHALVPWDFYFTHRLAVIKKEIAHLLPSWLDAWYELEALNSLANFSYLNPSYVFPEIVSEEMVFDSRALGHPLLKRETKICNDFSLDPHQKIVILTGSNMAGKSTFLRTVGVNLCLAYVGAPVNAGSLRVSLFRVFTCIKVSDSVQDGLSYFYAEVKRLKALLSTTETEGSLPLLFLIDEILRGTNSRERLIGSRAYIRELSKRRTLGLVATHDLDLVKLADEIAGVANYHFREEVHEGRMVFDYRLRPGPCPTTNALKILQLEGLPVS